VIVKLFVPVIVTKADVELSPIVKLAQTAFTSTVATPSLGIITSSEFVGS